MNLFIVFAAKYLFILIGLLAFLWFIFVDKKIQAQIIKLAVISFPFSFILAKILGYFISSPRPFVLEHIEPLIKASADNGFPSDHTLLAMTIGLVVFAYNKKFGMVLVVLSLFVGLGRVLGHAHHTIDVVGSILIASVAVYVSFNFIVQKIRYKLPYFES